MLARWYDPYTGRWLSRDPIGYEGGVNLYEYCEGNPVAALDPSGEDALVLVGGNDEWDGFFLRHAKGLAERAPEPRLRRALKEHHVRYVQVRCVEDVRSALAGTPRIDALVYIGHSGSQGLILRQAGRGSLSHLYYEDVMRLPLGHLIANCPIALYGCHTAERTRRGRTPLPSIAGAFANRTGCTVQAVRGGLSFGNPELLNPWRADGKLRPTQGMQMVHPGDER